MNTTPWQDYWVGQKAFIERDGKVLVVIDPDEGLDFPGGRIDKGEEDLEASLKREVHEESGLEIEVGHPFSAWHNIFPKGHKYEGQRVYLIGFRCTYISGEVTLSEEHNAYRWVSRDDFHEVNDGTEYFQYLKKYFEA